MAFDIDIMSPHDVVANYWKIDAKMDDFRSKQLDVLLRGYPKKETADARKSALMDWNVRIEGNNYVPDMTREQIYTWLKENTLEWRKAEFI